MAFRTMENATTILSAVVSVKDLRREAVFVSRTNGPSSPSSRTCSDKLHIAHSVDKKKSGQNAIPHTCDAHMR